MELLLEDPVLFDEILDDLGLATVDPASERDEEQLKRKEVGHTARFSGPDGAVVSLVNQGRSNNRTAR